MSRLARGPVSLTDGPITKSVVLFALPILVSNLVQQLYNSVDAAVVGQYAGSASLAAVGSTGHLIHLLIGFFLGISTGTGVLFAMHYGARNYPKLKQLIDSSLVISVIAGIFITVIGIVFCRPLLILMNSPEDVLPLSTIYLQIYFTGNIANLIYNVGAGIIRAEGDSTRPLIYLIISGVTNLVLDLLLVAVFEMGVAGAAIATVAAQVLSAILVIIRLMRMNPEYRLRLLQIHPDKVTVMEVIRIALPCGLQSSMFNISNLLVQAKINSFGTVAMAGITAYNKIDAFGYTSVHALGLATSTFVGQNVGAQKYRRLQKGIRVCMGITIAVSVTVGVLVILFCKPLLNLFTTDPEAQAVGIRMMWHIIPFSWLLCFMDVLGGSIRGAGQATAVTIISALCVCVFRILWLLIMLPIFNEIRIVFCCYPISWGLNALVTTIFYYKGSILRKKIKAELAAESVAST